MGNTRSRVVFIFTMLVLVIAIIIGIGIFSRTPEKSQAELSGPPGIKSVVGGFNQPVTPQYAKLLEAQNQQNAQVALQTGGNAVPTIISAQQFPNAPSDNVCNCTPSSCGAAGAGAAANLQTTGPAPMGT